MYVRCVKSKAPATEDRSKMTVAGVVSMSKTGPIASTPKAPPMTVKALKPAPNSKERSSLGT